MTMHLDHSTNRGGATVGSITDLDAVAAASVIYLRMWCSGPESQHNVRNDFASTLAADRGQHAIESFTELCKICARHGRRPLMHHAISCKCLGADEACFANFIAIAADGERDDAMLIATLLVRPDVAPVITALAMDVGLALKQMNLAAPRDVSPSSPSNRTTLH